VHFFTWYPLKQVRKNLLFPDIKRDFFATCWWLMAIILATQEAENRRIVV
jgi:hypothetical protein